MGIVKSANLRFHTKEVWRHFSTHFINCHAVPVNSFENPPFARLLKGLERKPDAEAGPYTFFAFELDLPGVFFYDEVDERQAHACPLAFGGVKGIEGMVHLFAGHTLSGIGHINNCAFLFT